MLLEMDVKPTYLNGILEEEIYVEQPPEHEIRKVGFNKLYKLRALYGL